ncbi:hypothetical protein [Alteromonas macleodii]
MSSIQLYLVMRRMTTTLQAAKYNTSALISNEASFGFKMPF